jgi:hypothetical protein
LHILLLRREFASYRVLSQAVAPGALLLNDFGLDMKNLLKFG